MEAVKLSMMAAIPTVIHAERCLWQRHQEAACKYCLEACPTCALQLEQREVTFDADHCLGCGVCLTACPVECFETGEWSERSLLSAIKRLKQPVVEVVCKCHPAPELGQEALPVLQINACLGAVSPGLWFEIGLEHAVVVHLEQCSRCPIARVAPYAQLAVELANSWLETCGMPARISLQKASPAPNPLTRRAVICAERPILSRRDFLFAFVRSSGPPAEALCCLPVDDPTGESPGKTPPHPPTWLRRLAAVYPGQLSKAAGAPQARAGELTPGGGEFGPGAEGHPAGAAHHAPSAEDAAAETPCPCAQWPTLNVADDCVACGACARYCPSGALSVQVIDGLFTHLFTPGACVACGLCAQVCNSNALTRSYQPEAQPFSERELAWRAAGACPKCGSPAVDILQGCYWCANEPPIHPLMEDARSMMLGI